MPAGNRSGSGKQQTGRYGIASNVVDPRGRRGAFFQSAPGIGRFTIDDAETAETGVGQGFAECFSEFDVVRGSARDDQNGRARGRLAPKIRRQLTTGGCPAGMLSAQVTQLK